MTNDPTIAWWSGGADSASIIIQTKKGHQLLSAKTRAKMVA
jgi:hypothetical protein